MLKQKVIGTPAATKGDNMNFTIGQIFKGVYPPEAAIWCNQNNAFIEQLSDGTYMINAVPERSLDEVKQDKLTEIAIAYETVLSYVLSPDSTSAVDTALAIQDFNADDPEGLAFIRQQLKARRTALEAAVAASFDADAVQAIVVSFNV